MFTPITSRHAVAFTCLFSTATLLSGCGSISAQYQPVVDGPRNSHYASDLSACSQVAEQREYLNDDVKSEALLGAGIGAVVGGLEDGGSGLVAGALIGGTAGAGGRAWDTREERKQIVVTCMRGRGHKVVG